MLFRLAYMQLFDASYKFKADAATIDKKIIYPSRGLVYDRNGILLVHNKPIYDLYATHNLLDPNMNKAKLSRILRMSVNDLEENLNKDWSDVRFSKNVPFLIKTKIDAITYAQLQEILHEFPGLNVQSRSVRGYNFSGSSHVLGYISEVDQSNLDNNEGKYEKGDYIGVSGLELKYEDKLKGQKGLEYQLKDNFGRKVGKYEDGDRDYKAVSGKNIITTLDIELQQYAESLMQGKTGSVVVIEPATGEVLTMLSSPAYDPNLLSVSADRATTFSNLQSDSLKPFFDRSLMAKYPPGSTFKPILALIALQEGVLTTNRYIKCTGAYYYKIYRWGCHAGPGVHNVTGAIEKSCNTFFYSVYRELVDQYGFDNPEKGLNHLSAHLNNFGLGLPLRIDLPSENPGLIPDSDYYDDFYEGKGDWRSTYIISNGIGQGEVELTTLQMANLAVIIGNRGFYRRPHLVKGYKNSAESIDPQYSDMKRVNINDTYFDPVIEGMERSISRGTARLASVPGIEVCGKTGTSENPHGKDHSVFYAFAPREKPQIAVAVYIENAGWGGTYAAPIGGLIIEKYLNKEIHPSKIWIENNMLTANLLANL
jgi:penicillin-binding protein 2